jgi:hypothetical protein
MPIKSFRGQIADDAIDTIVLHTPNGSTGYRIVKFQIMPASPGTTVYEHVMKIYKVPQTSADQQIDFSDNTLLAAAFIQDDSAAHYVSSEQVIFDKEIFNQDIYITHRDTNGALAANYYIELEQVKLDMNQNTVATLKDIRNNTQ